jgi:hypothetical protein
MDDYVLQERWKQQGSLRKHALNKKAINYNMKRKNGRRVRQWRHDFRRQRPRLPNPLILSHPVRTSLLPISPKMCAISWVHDMDTGDSPPDDNDECSPIQKMFRI